MNYLRLTETTWRTGICHLHNLGDTSYFFSLSCADGNLHTFPHVSSHIKGEYPVSFLCRTDKCCKSTSRSDFGKCNLLIIAAKVDTYLLSDFQTGNRCNRKACASCPEYTLRVC